MDNKEPIAVSVVVPVYNEQDNIKELLGKIERVLNNLHQTYEVIFIDDGSTDQTFNILKELSQNDQSLKIIRFRRNFGKSAALSAGFEKARGNFVITLDGDLQDDPDEIPNFLNKIQENYDVVVGWKTGRKDSITKKIPSRIFNKLAAWLTGVKIHDSNCGFKIFKNEVIKNIRIHGELHRYIPALCFWQGYKIAEIRVKHYPRKYGKSKYGFERLLRGFLDLITVKFLMVYMARPMHFFGRIGFVFLFLGFLAGAVSLVLNFVPPGIFLGGTLLPLLTAFLVLMGVQFILMGLLAEIMIRIYYEPQSKKMPYSIKEEINFKDDSNS